MMKEVMELGCGRWWNIQTAMTCGDETVRRSPQFGRMVDEPMESRQCLYYEKESPTLTRLRW
jgi:hypothetical protein